MEDGRELTINLIITKDSEVQKEIQQLWNAYSIKSALTVATITEEKEAVHTVSLWWDLRKQHTHKPVRAKVVLWQAGTTNGPTPIKGQSVELDIKDTPKLVTVRVLAPEHYRKTVAGVYGRDEPQRIISEWAQLVGCRAATLCGGNWQSVQHKHGLFIIGHVKVPLELANKTVALSGKRALFFTKVEKETKALVSWLRKSKDESDEEYLQRAQAQAVSKKLPLVLRQGGNSDLGVAGVSAAEVKSNHPRHFEVYGCPRYWTQDEVTVFLQKTGWKDPEIKAKVRRGFEHAWIFKAGPAPLQNDDVKGVYWQFRDTGGKCVFTIMPESKNKTKHSPMEWLKPPNKNKHLTANDYVPQIQSPPVQNEQAQPQVAPTQLEQGTQDSQRGQDLIQRDLQADRIRSPRRGQTAKTNEPASASSSARNNEPKDCFLRDYPGWSVIDCHGTGDCGFRTVAKGIAFNQNKNLNEEQLCREASKLRCFTTGHLIKHKEHFAHMWKPDSDTTREHCAQQDIPQDFSDYCMSASYQQFWVDTMLLEALMQRIGSVFIIFKWCPDELSWKRTVLAKKFQNEKAVCCSKDARPICLMLISDHFWFLQPPDSETALPDAWLLKTPERTRGFLRGAGKLSLPPETPSLRSNKPVLQQQAKTPARSSRQTPKKYVLKDKFDQDSCALSLPPVTPSGRSQTIGNKLAGASRGKSPSASLSIPVSTPRTISSRKQQAWTPQTATTVKNGRRTHSETTVQSNPQKKKSPVTVVPKPQSKKQAKEAYWTCPFPNCNFQVDNSLSQEKRPQRRKKHLNRVHNLKGDKLKELTNKERIERVIAKQETPLSIHHSSRPDIQLSLNLPVFPASSTSSSSIPIVWWRCTCGFEVFKSTHYEQKRIKFKHLRAEHGILRTNYAGQRESNAAFAPKRLNAARDSLQLRWEHHWKAFSKARWPRSHDLPVEATVWREYNSKNQGKCYSPFHVCKKCGIQVERNSWHLYSCPAAKSQKPLPTLKDRKAIWAKCRAEAHKTAILSKFADGTRATKKGLRAKKLGEATNPGPDHLRIWSQNMRSWHTNCLALLEDAASMQVDVLLLQETNVSASATPSIMNQAQRHGWQMIHAAPTSRNRGGVAVLVKPPLAIVELDRQQTENGQFIMAECHGLQESVLLGSLYRHGSDDQFQIPTELCHILQVRHGNQWIVGMDGNNDMVNGVISQQMQAVGGHRHSVARHQSSTAPIDAIWSSLPDSGVNLEIDGPGDHTIACSDFYMNRKARTWQQLRFPQPPRLIENPVLPQEVPDWATVASTNLEWSNKLSDSVDQIWECWIGDVELWLRHAGLFCNRTPEQKLGSVPAPVPGQHRMADQQNVPERQLRRYIRRLQEARRAALHGVQPNPTLLRKLLRQAVPHNERCDLQRGHWGAALTSATTRLQQLLKTKHDEALRKWHECISDISGACRWVRQDNPVPWIIKNSSGAITGDRAFAAGELRNYWQTIFGQQALDQAAFWNKYAGDVPDGGDAPVLGPITCAQILAGARKLKKKANGPDGLSGAMISLLPQPALIRAAQILNLFERRGTWPRALLEWRIVFLPKQKAGNVARLDEVRPICIGPTLYRVWASLRLDQMKPWLASFLGTHQAGGVGGPDVTTLLLTMELDKTSEAYPVALCLDYSKAFDSLDIDLAINILERIRAPSRVVRLLADQWRRHRRWVTFASCVAAAPLTGTRGLPQGDPWSPVALALTLLLPLRQSQRTVPAACSLLYLDDRTLLAPDVNTLQNVETCWNELEEVTRLRTNVQKTQVWARTVQGFLDLQAQGRQPQFQVEILGVSCGFEGRCCSNSELQRQTKSERYSEKLALLPKSHKFLATLCSLMLTSTMTWGAFLGGHFPTKKSCKRLHKQYVHAVKGFHHKESQTSRELQQVFLLGHGSDFLLTSSLRALKALCKWRERNPAVLLPQNSPFIKLLTRAMTELGCTIEGPASYRFHDSVWSSETPLAWCDRLGHLLRNHWRKRKMETWLQSQRNDAEIARGLPLNITPKLVDDLHTACKSLDGWELSVMAGGVSCEAKWQSRDSCRFCQKAVCPSTWHLFWECQAFGHLRRFAAPENMLVARVGWGNEGVVTHWLKQMAQIRKAAVKLRLFLDRNQHPFVPPDPGGGGGEGGGGGGRFPLRTELCSCELLCRAATASHRAASMMMVFRKSPLPELSFAGTILSGILQRKVPVKESS